MSDSATSGRGGGSSRASASAARAIDTMRPAAATGETTEKRDWRILARRPPRRRASRQERRDRRIGLIMLAPAVITTTLVLIYPMIVALQSSFYKINTVTRSEVFVGLQNYLSLRTDPTFWAALWRTLIWTVGAIGSQAVVGIMVAIALNKKVRGLNLVRGVVLFPYLVPAIVAVLTWRWIFSGTVGVANYLLVDVTHLLDAPISWFHPKWAMVSVIIMSLWKYLPYWAIFILARLQSVPEELHEAAMIDGASPWQRFRFITWPWIMPVVMVLVVLRSIWAFREFDMVYLPAAGGPLQRTTTIPVYIRHVAFDLTDIGRAAAVAIALLVVVVLLNQMYLRIYERSEARLD